MKFSDMVLVQMYCPNCGHRLAEYSDENGSVKIMCKHCGIFLVSRRNNRGEKFIHVIPKTKEVS